MADTARIDRLLELATETGALKFGEFKLSSGKKSSYYFDGRLLSLHPEGINLISDAMLEIVSPLNLNAVGGPTLAADPIVAGICLKSFFIGGKLSGFIVRKEAKQHGMSQLIEGTIEIKDEVLIVDDTCTTGGSLFHAINAVQELGGIVKKVMVVLDRNEGGSKTLIDQGFDFEALITVNEDGKFIVNH